MSSVDEILAGYDGLQAAACGARFGDRAAARARQTASEDFSGLPRAAGVPCPYRGIGGTGPQACRAAEKAGRVAAAIPGNHSPQFPPVPRPALRTGTGAPAAAALAWPAPR